MYNVYQPTDEEIYREIVTELHRGDKAGFREKFFENHTYDQAQIYLNLDPSERAALQDYISPEELAEIYDVIDEEDQESVLGFLYDMSDQYAATVLAYMYRDNAVDILNELGDQQVRRYLHLMPIKAADEISVLMNYAAETAGSLMTTEFVSIFANQTVKSAMALLRAKAANAETIYYLYVVNDDNRLVGVISLKDLLISDSNTMITDIMSNRIVSGDVNENQVQIANKIKDYDFLALPITAETGQLVGIITVDDIIDVIDEEATSDYSGLAAVDVEEQQSFSPGQAAKSRLPWLITLLVLGMGTSTLIGRFEGMISEVATLSLFITLITGTAGNAGTQSLAVAVRRLAAPEDAEDKTLFSLILREITTGLISGLITGIVICTIVSIWQGNLALGLVIGIAMLAAITVANLAGSLIPILMDRLGFDPAVASGPFITTLSDLTSVLIYFSIASQFLVYLK
ncbi:magnesium transporter MgtE [Aerococcus urinaehominis]|uniref:Magnesium transporter MgtE n=1 Tax=Aerococcus urinaehominis TaxID=128944 RepID=A0A0X8FMP9_9LACT|nr:magnesium transporter MgtE [Aerococcus urinaehominis]